jgi:hypothetical protein
MRAPESANTLSPDIVGNRWSVANSAIFFRKSEVRGILDRDQRIRVLTHRSFERTVDIGGLPYFQRLELDPKRSGRAHGLFEHQSGIGIGRIPQNGYARKFGKQLLQQFQPLPTEIGCHEAHPGDVAAGVGQARDEPASYRVARRHHDDRNRRGGLFGGKRRQRPHCHDNLHL